MAQTEAAREHAKLEAEKELSFKELELKVQEQASTSSVVAPIPRNRHAKSPKIPSFIDKKDELDSYLLHFEPDVQNASWEKNTWAIKLSAVLTGRALTFLLRCQIQMTMTTTS